MTATATQTATAGSAVPQNKAKRMGRAPSDTPAGPLTYIALVVTFLISAFPLYWAFVLGSGGEDDLADPTPSPLPKGKLLDNYDQVFNDENVNFVQSLWNSLIVSTIVTLSVLFFCSLAGFAFAKLRFKGRNVLMLLLIATMTIPNQLGLVALYIVMNWLGWNGELAAVIFPGLVTAFGVFYMRQSIADAIPDELIEAARVDGASTFRTFWSVVLPTLTPPAAVLGLLTFATAWNDFQWPLMTLSGTPNPTVQVAISTLAAGQFPIWSKVIAGATLATLPLLAVFAVGGKQIVAGIMEGAVKA